jgi:hypothetical protein
MVVRKPGSKIPLTLKTLMSLLDHSHIFSKLSLKN